MLLLIIFFAPIVVALVPFKLSPQFSWSTNVDSSKQIPSCSTVTVTYSPLSSATVTLTSPMQLGVYVDGYPARFYLSTGTAVSGSISQQIALPVGAAVTFTMEDSNGYSGGAAGPYKVIAGSSCTLVTTAVSTSPTLALASSVVGNTICGTSFDITPSGATSPYNFELVDPDLAQGFIALSPSNFTSTTSVEFSSLAPPGTQVYVTLYDANGYSSVSHLLTVASSCTGQASASPSSPGSTSPALSSSSSVSSSSVSSPTPASTAGSASGNSGPVVPAAAVPDNPHVASPSIGSAASSCLFDWRFVAIAVLGVTAHNWGF